MDVDMDVRSARTTSQNELTVLEPFFFPRQACSFVPPRTAGTRGAVCVLPVAERGSIAVQVLLVDDSDSIVELGVCSTPLNPNVRVL